MRIIRVASPFFGATLILASPRKNSSYVKLPSPLVSRELKRRRTDSSSMSSEILIFFCSSRVGLYLATSASTDSPFNIAPITSQNCWCVLRCVAVCCSVLQCVAVCCSVVECLGPTRRLASRRLRRRTVGVCCGVLQCVAVCCSVLQSG